MQEKIHPPYKEITITCGCGNSFSTGSTRDRIAVEVCSACHPFYTGKEKFMDAAGRVERFQKKYSWSEEERKKIEAKKPPKPPKPVAPPPPPPKPKVEKKPRPPQPVAPGAPAEGAAPQAAAPQAVAPPGPQAGAPAPAPTPPPTPEPPAPPPVIDQPPQV